MILRRSIHSRRQTRGPARSGSRTLWRRASKLGLSQRFMRLFRYRVWFSSEAVPLSGRGFVFRTLVVAAILILVTARASAAIHPVPLDPKADPSTCLQCHEDKTKGKSVHSAMQLGCLSCHEIRVNKDVTRVKLITATPVSLCLTCHADKKASDIKGTVHPPAVRDCLTCHDPHDERQQEPVAEAGVGRGQGQSLP